MRPTRINVVNGTPQQYIVDYFNTNISFSFVPTGGASMVVTATLDDPNDSTYTPVYFALPAPLAAAITTNTLAWIQLVGVRAVKFTVSVGGSCLVTILQASGDGSGVGT